MRIRKILISTNSALLSYIFSFLLFQLLKIKYIFKKVSAARYIQLKKNASVSIHYKTNIQLKNSRIILHEGACFKVAYNYGYFDKGGFNPNTDICRIHLENSTLHIYGTVSLYPGMSIIASNGTVTIKNNTTINGFSQIICKSAIDIGENCIIAQGVIIRDDDGHKHGKLGEPLTNTPKPVVIGDNCWIGQRSMILKGACIGSGSIIAAGAIVSKVFEANKIIAGVPAKVIAHNHQWEQ